MALDTPIEESVAAVIEQPKVNTDLQFQKNRKYKGLIRNGYIYYRYQQIKVMKDGTLKSYQNIVRKKRPLIIKGRGKDKKPRKKRSPYARGRGKDKKPRKKKTIKKKNKENNDL